MFFLAPEAEGDQPRLPTLPPQSSRERRGLTLEKLAHTGHGKAQPLPAGAHVPCSLLLPNQWILRKHCLKEEPHSRDSSEED